MKDGKFESQEADIEAVHGKLGTIQKWITNNPQEAGNFAIELKAFFQWYLDRITRLDDMIEFRTGIDHERWNDFTEACNTAEGRELSPAEVERMAFDIWTGSIDAVIKYYRTNEKSAEPVVLTIWKNKEKGQDA